MKEIFGFRMLVLYLLLVVTGGKTVFGFDEILPPSGGQILSGSDLSADPQSVPGLARIFILKSPLEGGHVSGGGGYSPGSMVAVTASPNPHYFFVNWTDGGQEVSTNSRYEFVLFRDKILTANFRLIPYSVSVAADPASAGKVYGGGIYDYGTRITVRAEPESGYAFVSWSEGDLTVSTDSVYSFAVSGDRDLIARFTPVSVPTLREWGVILLGFLSLLVGIRCLKVRCREGIIPDHP